MDAGYAFSYPLTKVPEPEPLEYLPEILPQDIMVLSVGNDTVNGKLRTSQVIVDAGATESACGIRTMERFLEASGCRYDVALTDRPTFRFGDGRTLQALSRVDAYTPALGLVSVYVLDDPNSQDTPLLLGGRTLRQVKATVNYGDETLMFLRRNGQLAFLPLVSTLGGHMVVDLAVRSTSLGAVQDYLRKELGVVLPEGEVETQRSLMTPGFSYECRRGTGKHIPGTDEDDAAPGIGMALQLLKATHENKEEHGFSESVPSLRTSECSAVFEWQLQDVSDHVCHVPVAHAYPVFHEERNCREPLDVHDRLGNLRLKLEHLQGRQHERTFRAAASACGRPPVGRMALYGPAQGRGVEIKSTRPLGDVPSLRDSSQVLDPRSSERKPQDSRSVERSGGNGDWADPHGVYGQSGDGENDRRQVHGDHRADAPGRPGCGSVGAHEQTPQGPTDRERDDDYHHQSLSGGDMDGAYVYGEEDRGPVEPGGVVEGSTEASKSEGKGCPSGLNGEIGESSCRSGGSGGPRESPGDPGPGEAPRVAEGGAPGGDESERSDGTRRGRPQPDRGVRRSGCEDHRRGPEQRESRSSALWARLGVLRDRIKSTWDSFGGTEENAGACLSPDPPNGQGGNRDKGNDDGVPTSAKVRGKGAGSSTCQHSINSKTRKSLVASSFFLVSGILQEAASVTAAVGSPLDFLQVGGPSTLCEAVREMGYETKRVQPDSLQKMSQLPESLDAKVLWVSLPLRALLQDTFPRTQISPKQQVNHDRAARRDRALLRDSVGCVARHLQNKRDFVLELPAKLRSCWDEVEYLKDLAIESNMVVYDFLVQGCAYKCGDLPLHRTWRVMTTCEGE